jgi:hypothetical protein
MLKIFIVSKQNSDFAVPKSANSRAKETVVVTTPVVVVEPQVQKNGAIASESN